MFDSLGLKLQDTIQNLRGAKKISEDNIDSSLNEIRRNLLEADVSLKAVKLFTARVKKEALGAEVLTGVNPGEQFVKIIYDSLVEVLGGSLESDLSSTDKQEDGSQEKSADKSTKILVKDKLQLPEQDATRPSSILLLGLQGAGKTTAAAKLAYKLKTENHKPLLVPCDLQRPAAVRQLQILSEQAEVDFLNIIASDAEDYSVKSPLELSELAFKQAKENGNTVLIFDTAGRLQVDTDLMAELLILEKQAKPDQKLLVIDSLIGQEAANVAETFNTQIGIDGTVLTKLDSDTRGGAALSVVEATQKPIKLASVGEKLEDIESFYPDRAASRILGMGDVLSLVEKAEERINEEEQKRLEEELKKGNFNYETFMSFQSMLSKLGNFSSIFKMMGMGNMLSQMGLGGVNQDELLEAGEGKFKRYKIAINSMTKKERKNPALLSTDPSAKSRRARIMRGSGLKETDIAQLTAEFTKMSKAFQKIGPLLSMMPSDDSEDQNNPQVNPMDLMNNMMGGMSKKQRKALKQSGAMGSMMGQVAPKASVKKVKKGAKPKIKGFNR